MNLLLTTSILFSLSVQTQRTAWLAPLRPAAAATRVVSAPDSIRIGERTVLEQGSLDVAGVTGCSSNVDGLVAYGVRFHDGRAEAHIFDRDGKKSTISLDTALATRPAAFHTNDESCGLVFLEQSGRLTRLIPNSHSPTVSIEHPDVVPSIAPEEDVGGRFLFATETAIVVGNSSLATLTHIHIDEGLPTTTRSHPLQSRLVPGASLSSRDGSIWFVDASGQLLALSKDGENLVTVAKGPGATHFGAIPVTLPGSDSEVLVWADRLGFVSVFDGDTVESYRVSTSPLVTVPIFHKKLAPGIAPILFVSDERGRVFAGEEVNGDWNFRSVSWGMQPTASPLLDTNLLRTSLLFHVPVGLFRSSTLDLQLAFQAGADDEYRNHSLDLYSSGSTFGTGEMIIDGYISTPTHTLSFPASQLKFQDDSTLELDSEQESESPDVEQEVNSASSKKTQCSGCQGAPSLAWYLSIPILVRIRKSRRARACSRPGKPRTQRF